MDDIYLKLQAEIDDLRSEATEPVLFVDDSMDPYLGGPADTYQLVDGIPALPEDQASALQEGMLRTLAILRGMYWVYQNAHWTASGPQFYSDRLLYQRLYEGVAWEVGGLGERVVGCLGPQVIRDDELLARSQSYVVGWCQVEDPYNRALAAEVELQETIRACYQMMEGVGALTLGLEEILRSLSDAHETHIYLLQQRLAPQKRAKRASHGLRISGLGDLSGFLRVSEHVLVHKCDRDLWRLTKDANGNDVIEKLYEGNLLPY